MSDRIPMTRAGYDKLKAEADELETVEMPKLAQRVAAARSEGGRGSASTAPDQSRGPRDEDAEPPRDGRRLGPGLDFFAGVSTRRSRDQPRPVRPAPPAGHAWQAAR